MPTSRRVAVIIPAAGSGQRLGGGTPKALRLLRGASLLAHAVRSMTADPDVVQLVLAVPAGAVSEIRANPPACAVPVTVVAGGASRQASVAAALAAVDPSCDVVLVHDAARPVVPGPMLRRVIRAVGERAPAVVPGLPVVDTIKRIDERGFVLQTPPRDRLRAVQTPQGFVRAVLVAAHAAAADEDSATDDAALVERAGYPVLVVDGDPAAMKVTRPEDLVRIEELLAHQEDA